MKEEFKPFLINDRSSAIVNFIDASQFTEGELVDVYLGIVDRLENLIDLKPTISFEMPDRPVAIALPTSESVNEMLDGILKECRKHNLLLFQVTPHEALSLLGMVQAAIVSLPIPESLETFGKQFISQFCEKYKIEFPSICESLKVGWNESSLMSRDEQNVNNIGSEQGPFKHNYGSSFE